MKHYLEDRTKWDSITFDENIVSETSIQKNWWNFTSSIFNKEYKFKLSQKDLFFSIWNFDWKKKTIEWIILQKNRKNVEKIIFCYNRKAMGKYLSMENTETPQRIENRMVFSNNWLQETRAILHKEPFAEVVFLEYKQEKEETDVIEVIQNNANALQKLFDKEIQKERIVLEKKWKIITPVVVEKIYKKYAKETSFWNLAQNMVYPSVMVSMVERLWKNTQALERSVQTIFERSVLSKKITTLFSKQEWIKLIGSHRKEVEAFRSPWNKDIVERQIVQREIETREKSISYWNIEEIENLVSKRMIDYVENTILHKNDERMEMLVSDWNRNNVEQHSFRFSIKLIENILSYWSKNNIEQQSFHFSTDLIEKAIFNWNSNNIKQHNSIFSTDLIEKVVSDWNRDKIAQHTFIETIINTQRLETRNLLFNRWLQENPIIFSETEFIEVVPLEYKQEKEETNFVETLQENVNVLQELFDGEVQKERIAVENEWKVILPTVVEKIYKKYAKETSFWNQPQNIGYPNVTVSMVKHLWKNKQEMERSVRTTMERSLLFKGIIPLFSNQDWIKPLVSDRDKNRKEVEAFRSPWNKETVELRIVQGEIRKNITIGEEKSQDSFDVSLEQTIVYKLEKKSEETKEILNKEMKRFIYSQVEQIVQSKIEDYEVRRNQAENQKIEETLEKMVEKKTKEQERGSQIQLGEFDIEEIYEKVYQKIERNLRSEMRKTGR